MEGLEKAWSSGIRDISSSISRSMSRRNWGMEDVFVGSSRRSYVVDEDEDALVWAALDKLPTYDRLRTGIIKSFVDNESTQTHFHKEVDVRKLDVHDRQEFIERIFRVAEEDNEKFLRKFRNRIEKQLHEPFHGSKPS